jgi:phage terminase large subunit-like protein
MPKKKIKRLAELMQLPGYDPYEDAKDCYYDPEEGDRVVQFFGMFLSHVHGSKAGDPFDLEPWQISMLKNLFGWKRADGSRRYRQMFLYIPRKNGKTIITAGIILYVLFADGEKGAQIFSSAFNEEQSSLIFNMARGMVNNDEDLQEMSTVLKKSIYLNDDPLTVFKPLSGSIHGKHGLNVHLAAVDELHEHPNWDLVEPLVSSMGARKQPLTIYMTTADFNRPSPCNDLHKLAKDILAGHKKDYTFLPIVYEADKEDDWKDPKTWAKANPNLGVSVFPSFFEDECIKAENSPSYLNTFKRLYLNIKTDADTCWIPLEVWDHGADTSLRIEDFFGEKCYVGFDYASKQDFSAMVIFFPEFNIFFEFLFLPEARKMAYHESEWIDEGHIEITPGNTADQDLMMNKLRWIAEHFQMDILFLDAWGNDWLAAQLTEEGMNVILHQQSFKAMTEPVEKLQTLLLDKELKHSGNPVMRWMFSNIVVTSDSNGHMRLNKQKSAGKIDGIIALVMSLTGTIIPEEDTTSVYEERGITFL